MATVVNDKLISWATDTDDGTLRQAEKARLPILAGPVASMADAHVGIGATVGSVVATDGEVIPSAVGVDLGCGTIAADRHYVADMLWAQDYPRANRDQMMDRAMREVTSFVGAGRETWRVNCHHNFCQQERHAGCEVWVTRKGAIKVDVGDYGIIPGSMGNQVMADQQDLVEVLHTLRQILNSKGVR